MPHKIFLIPCEPYDAHSAVYDWALYDLQGLKVSGGANESLDDIVQILMQNGADSVPVVFVWPGNLSFYTHVDIPAKATRFAQQALAYAVEDKLAADINSLHYASAKSQVSKGMAVHCVDKALLLSHTDLILERDPELTLNASHVDADLLALDGFDCTISLSGNAAIVRSPKQSLRLNSQNLIPYLDTVFLSPDDSDDDDATQANNDAKAFRLKVYDHDNDNSDHKILLAELEQYPGSEVSIEPLKISQLELLAESYFHSGAPSIDLCQGEFKVQHENGSSYKQWAWVVGVAALAFFIQIGIFVGKGFYYQDKAGAVNSQAVAEYKQLVPSAKRVSAARLSRIIKGKLRQTKGAVGEVDFLTLLGEAGYQYQQRKNTSGIQFTGMNYSGQRGELVIEIRAKNFQEMDQLKNALAASGLNAKISSAVQEDSYYRGRLSVSEG